MTQSIVVWSVQAGMMQGGTIVDTALISAPSSTKNVEKKRGPEMRQTGKGNQWYFGMKCHTGVDACNSFVHTAEATAAHVHDITVAAKLLQEGDEVVYGDSAYLEFEKRDEIKQDSQRFTIDFRVTSGQTDCSGPLTGSGISRTANSLYAAKWNTRAGL